MCILIFTWLSLYSMLTMEEFGNPGKSCSSGILNPINPDTEFSGIPNPVNPNPENRDSWPIFRINTENPGKKSNFFRIFFYLLLSDQEKSCIVEMLITKMSGNPENLVLLNRKTKYNQAFFFWKFWKKFFLKCSGIQEIQ